jgi:spermidine synthase
VSWLFVLAYTLSGLAGLIYQVCWTRLLTLYVGHTTAAVSGVVGAFLGGLAAGAALGAVLGARLTPRQAVLGYAVLELTVAGLALLMPFELAAVLPVLSWAYNDGSAPIWFPATRVLVCLFTVFVPATALGATFPLAVRYFAAQTSDRARLGGALYALNTVGAAGGALLAGFVLVPRLGVSGTTWVAVGASVAAATCAAAILARSRRPESAPRAPERHERSSRPGRPARVPESVWLAGLALGLSGFAALLQEITWTRVLTMVFGPTTYAFAATLAAVVLGIASGSAVSTALVSRTRQPALWLAVVLAAAAATGVYTSSLAGGPIPRIVAEQIARAPNLFDELVWRGGALSALLIVPTAALLGAAFPLALAMADDPARPAARQFGSIYAINTIGSVAGALAAGFLFVPLFGLEVTVRIAALCLGIGALLVLTFAALRRRARIAGAIASAFAIAMMFTTAPWDRELLASGVYLYAPFVPPGLPLEPLLKAGTLLYYREGAAATVSVKRLTGTNTLAVDGKTDASNRGDMLTQKLVAHLPLLLHERPREVAIIGLGSGVTVGAALTHPIDRVEVIELSPEVVEASDLFAEENRRALADPRTRLLVADGRSHLLLSSRKYDVIVSEPSNPWIAGVAALFTREFFETARDRLAPGGLICQWANAYNISDRDLRAIVATFRSVFPHGTAWLVGGDDVVLVASDRPLDDRLHGLARHWRRNADVEADLRRVGAIEPFSLFSLYVAGPRELERYGTGAEILIDDRMTLEFSAPRELGSRRPGTNGAILRALLEVEAAPAAIREARLAADAGHWSRRGAMMVRRDAFSDAYEDYVQALRLDPGSVEALDGMVRTAILIRHQDDALLRLAGETLPAATRAPVLVARSRLLASTGARAEAIRAAEQALDGPYVDLALVQLAEIYADASDNRALEDVIARMRARMPPHAAVSYYAAVAAFLRGRANDALRLAEDALTRDPSYAAAYDLAGAAHVRLGDRERARQAFLTSLTFDAHDSTAYANLGVLALDAGDRAAAADYFAEALWLDADSTLAREGLRRAIGAR